MKNKTVIVITLTLLLALTLACKKEPVHNSDTGPRIPPGCRLEATLSITTNCAPGGDPEITLNKDGTIMMRIMKEYGMAHKGYDVLEGKYYIDISSIQKRKFETTSIPIKIMELWSARIIVEYKGQPSFSAYIIDTGDERYPFEFDQLCSREMPLDQFILVK